MPDQVSAVWRQILRKPQVCLVAHWNWKSGATSAMLRGVIYFFVNLPSGFHAAGGAMLVEFSYRTFLSGACGAVTQALRTAEPPWAAALSAMAILPMVGHLVEFTVHYFRGTPRLKSSIATSIGFTILATLINLYAMRRGVLITGDGSSPLAQDYAALPRIIGGFIVAGPKALYQLFRRTQR